MSSQALNKQARLGLALALSLLLGACTAHAARQAPPPAVTPAVGTTRSAPPPTTAPAAGSATASAPAAVPAAAGQPVPPAARADFDRAVKYMRAGNATEAELGFKQIALQYPQFATPLVDLGILQRKQGELDQAEASLKAAVAKESGNAVAWTELGVTQRLRGEFKDAAASYEKAIAADGHYAPAWRNLGVLSDLYLGDPNRALAAFEQYKALTGEDKPVNGWIAELRQRLGMAAPKRPDTQPAGEGGQPAADPGAKPQDPPPAAPANAAAGAAAPKPGG